jgi:predicted secreted protein
MAIHQITSDGGEAHVAAGDEVVVRLEENPGTGYQWSVRELPPGMEVVSSEHRQGERTAPGAGGERVIVLRAAKPVAGEVRLALARSWEIEQAPLQEFTLSLHASEPA